MQVSVTGRHMSVSDQLKTHCSEKAERLIRFFDRITRVEVVLDGHDGMHSAEMIVHSDGTPPFVASEEHADPFAAVDLLIDKLERQISRHKEKLRNRKHPRG
jgi:putative sigma-54 modulation protein